jgi:excisionase family DNA binding protein
MGIRPRVAADPSIGAPTMTTAVAAPPALLTIHEAAEYLRISPRTLFALSQPRGPIPCARIGRSVRYTVAALNEFVEQQFAAIEKAVAHAS